MRKIKTRPDDWLNILKETFSYNPETGLITAIKKVRGYKIGDNAGYVSSKSMTNKYLQFHFKCKTSLAHQIAWYLHYGIFPDKYIDHINGNGLDNRIVNLRLVDDTINNQNRTKSQGNTSKYIGVSFKKNRWVAQIKCSNKTIHLGTFTSEDAAYEVYLKAKRQLHEGCTL